MGFDLLIILGIIFIPAVAQIFVSINYNKYKKIESKSKLSGFEIARKILDDNDLEDVHIVENRGGTLSDHYDSSRKVIRLSTDVFHGETVASMAIAAHEVSHAIQDKDGYFFMKFRTLLFPIVRVATSVSYFFIFFGLILEMLNLFYLGVGFVGLGLLFQVVTLPVEFNASTRAKVELKKIKVLEKDESDGVEKVLGAAAMTYVAGVLALALQILRYVLLFTGRRD